MKLETEEYEVLQEILGYVRRIVKTEDAEKLSELMGTEDIPEEVLKRLLDAVAVYELCASGNAEVLHSRHGLAIPEGEYAFLDRQAVKDLKKTLKARPPKAVPRKLYISDLHFYHEGLCRKMDMRPFHDYREMNEAMIAAWNAKVNARDEVYILGDFSIAKGLATNEILKQLKGRLYMIRGNHDAFLDDAQFQKERFLWIRDYAEIKDAGRKVVLSHYPVFCYNGQYRKDNGIPFVYMLYGHVHNTYDEVLVNRFIQETRAARRISKYDEEPEPIPCNMINTFCMFSEYAPLTLDEWIENDRARRQAMNTFKGE